MSRTSDELGLTPLQEMQVVYNYFTLHQWEYIASGLKEVLKRDLPLDHQQFIRGALAKMPSEAL
jgi:hypothetical protein